jgi:thiamine-monophosphate kinase
MRRLSEVNENRLLSRWAELLPRPAWQVGAVHETDAELVPLGDGRLLALTVDTVEEAVRLGIYRDPYTAGCAAATAALSDLAAAGAEPLGLLLSVSLPRSGREPVQERVATGVAEVCREAGTFVLGGDTNEAGALAVTCVAAGLAPADAVLTRVGAGPGETLYASGLLGSGAALAAAALLGLPGAEQAETQWRPLARLKHGRALRSIASVCMDTSDGLVATLDQLARLNGLAIRIEAPPEALLTPQARKVREELGLPALSFLAAQHGEFELVFTVPDARLDRLEQAAGGLGWMPIRLGRTEPGEGLRLGNRSLDGARIRNLLDEAGGDLSRYVKALCSLEA